MVGNSTNGVGVSASTQNANENAIFGINTATGAAAKPVNAIAGCGVWGHTKVTGATGVVGSTEPGVNATGVLGIGNGTEAGVAGINNFSATSNVPAGPGVFGSSGWGTGVSASSTEGTGVSASSQNGAGVSASSVNSTGVTGTSTNGVGVSAGTQNANQNAIFGINTATVAATAPVNAIAGCGVWGHTTVPGGTGVVGSTEPSVTATGVLGIGNGEGDGVRGVAGPPPEHTSQVGPWAGVHGIAGTLFDSFAGLFDGAVQINGDLFSGTVTSSPSSDPSSSPFAGVFNGPVQIISLPSLVPSSFDGEVDIHGLLRVEGDLNVTGTVTKGSGGFQIDHPLDPANKYLVHSFVESPDMKNVYDGVAVADSLGEVSVELPAYFDALNKDFRYQLTPIGGPAPNLHVKQELTRNRFLMAGAAPGQRVCWQITGTRKDAWALANPIVVEREKPKSEKEHFESDTRSSIGIWDATKAG
ncbi:MAG: hypothetical protein JO110_03720 [Acetobacteraceae bacterium]|nr:hypothetical protein [Acetobacteraceae bacterium]